MLGTLPARQTLADSVWWPASLDHSLARKAGMVLSVLFPLCYGLLGVWVGKDAGWDLQNYHWYNPYAFLTGRLGVDLAVGHHATYFNPFLDIPLYWAGEHLPSSLVGFLLSLVQGLNFPLLFWLAWTLFSPLTPGQRLAVSAVTAIAGMSGAGALMGLAGCANDNITSLGVLASLLIMVCRHQTLINGNRLAAGGWAGLAGIVAGVTAGLKLTTATYALGLGGALLFIPASLPRRITLAFSCAVGGLIGLALGGGFWMHRLWEFSGSPFFPYFNDLLHSPLLSDASYRDKTFIPTDLLTRILFPFYFSFDSFRVAEWYFRDIRILTAFVVLIGSASWILASKVRKACLPADSTWIDPAPGRYLAVASAISYAAWLWMFCIYRYLLPLEMIAPLLIAVALGGLPLSNKSRTALLLTLLILSQAMVEVSFGGRKPWGDRYLEVTAPLIPGDEQAMVLMTGYEPMSFVIPSFPTSTSFLRIEGFLAGAEETTGLTALMHRRVSEHRGTRYVLFDPRERDFVPKALAAYGLHFEELSCQKVASNIIDPLKFCRVYESQLP